MLYPCHRYLQLPAAKEMGLGDTDFLMLSREDFECVCAMKGLDLLFAKYYPEPSQSNINIIQYGMT